MTGKRRYEQATAFLGDTADRWCPACLKSSASRTPVHLLTTSGPRTIGELIICEECGWSPYDSKEQQ